MKYWESRFCYLLIVIEVCVTIKNFSTYTYHTVACNVNEFACANGYGCLDKNVQLCDGSQLCLDASDESDCLGM